MQGARPAPEAPLLDLRPGRRRGELGLDFPSGIWGWRSHLPAGGGEKDQPITFQNNVSEL